MTSVLKILATFKEVPCQILVTTAIVHFYGTHKYQNHQNHTKPTKTSTVHTHSMETHSMEKVP